MYPVREACQVLLPPSEFSKAMGRLKSFQLVLCILIDSTDQLN